MKESERYLQDLAEIRSMMQKSSKFLSLSGWAGIMAGFYAIAGYWVAEHYLGFSPDCVQYSFDQMHLVLITASVVLFLALISALLFSKSSATKRGEQVWTPASKEMLMNMAIPLLSGGILVLIFISKGMIGLIAPTTLLFYGLSLYSAGSFTLKEVRILGCIQILLGLINYLLIDVGLLLWMLGFGVTNLLYGVIMYLRYKR